MEMLPVLGISLIQLCTSSLGDRNGGKSGLIATIDTASAGPSSIGSTGMTEVGNFVSEALMTCGNNISFGADKDLEFDPLLDFIDDGKDDRGLFRMIEDDAEAPVIEQGLEGTNGNILPTFSECFGKGSLFDGRTPSVSKPMILPSILLEHPSYDPSSVPIFTSPSLSQSEVNEDTEYENPAVCSPGNDKDYYDGCDVRSVTRQKNKKNHCASTTSSKLRERSNTAESDAFQEKDEKKTNGTNKRRLELLAYRETENKAGKSDSDETESEPRKIRKIASNPELADDYEEQYISFKALKAKKKRLEEDIRRCASFEEWVEEQHREARKKNETLDKIDILLKVLEGLGLAKRESPDKRDVKRASLSKKGTEKGQEKDCQDDANTDQYSEHTLCLVKSVRKHGSKQKRIRHSDLGRVASSKMRIHFKTHIFFSIVESTILSYSKNIPEYLSIRKGIEDKVLPIGSLARKKYAYLRSALIEAGIKVIEARVGSMHALYLDNKDGEDTLELSNIAKSAYFFEEVAEYLIKFTGARRVFYTIHRRDLYKPAKNRAKEGILDDKRKSAKRRRHHKKVAQWLEQLQDKHNGEGTVNRVEYLLAVQRRTNKKDKSEDKKFRSLLVELQIIDDNSKLQVRSADNLMNSILEYNEQLGEPHEPLFS